jgi:hypothetical protein
MRGEYTASDLLPSRPSRVLLIAWAMLAVLNLAAGVVIASSPERQSDLDMMRGWGRAWLVDGIDIYAPGDITDPDYPPHAIVALTPLWLTPQDWAVPLWAAANLMFAVVAVALAVRLARPHLTLPGVLLPWLMLLCWGGFRTLLQFSLLTLVAGLLAMRLAARRPALGGVCLGLALMKPQMAVPFVVWVVFARRWRTLAFAVVTVGMGFLVYCLRVAANPLAVVERYAEILKM